MQPRNGFHNVSGGTDRPALRSWPKAASIIEPWHGSTYSESMKNYVYKELRNNYLFDFCCVWKLKHPKSQPQPYKVVGFGIDAMAFAFS